MLRSRSPARGAATYIGKHGYPVPVDTWVDELSADDFDAVVIPGGYAPDHLRRHRPVLELVRTMFEQGKVVAAICHAAWVLISAGILPGRWEALSCRPRVAERGKESRVECGGLDEGRGAECAIAQVVQSRLEEMEGIPGAV